MCLLLTLIGLSLSVKAQGLVPVPLDGIFVTSYTASTSVQSPLSPASLSLDHTDNLGFDGSRLSGESSGDAIAAPEWDLEVFAENYEAFVAGAGNLLGLDVFADESNFQLGETLTISFGLTFGSDQLFQAVNPAIIGVASTTPTFATLTPFGGSSENLLNTAANTLFPAGDYILFMGGEILL